MQKFPLMFSIYVYFFRIELSQHKKTHHGTNSNAIDDNSFNTPRVQLSCSLCTYKTFSQDILDDHMDSQHRGELPN